MRRLIWALPVWCHELILRFFQRRLVKVVDTDYDLTSYLWTSSYPLKCEDLKGVVTYFRMGSAHRE